MLFARIIINSLIVYVLKVRPFISTVTAVTVAAAAVASTKSVFTWLRNAASQPPSTMDWNSPSMVSDSEWVS